MRSRTHPALPPPIPVAMDASAALGRLLAEPPARPWRHVAAVAGVLLAHVAAGGALMQLDVVRQAVQQTMPLMVNLLPAAAPLPPPSAPPAPPPRRLTPPPRPAPVIAAAPAPDPEPAVFEAPPAPVEPSPPPTLLAPAPPALVTTPPAPPAEPRTVAATDVRYLQPPVVVYPAFSKRRREAGRVLVRVLVDAAGRPAVVSVGQSSGFQRLDEAAVAALRVARFVPYTENGVPQPMLTYAPVDFEPEN
jgi:protein TonB